MTLKISRSQVSIQPNPTQPNPPKIKKTLTQPNPTQPNPWMDPTHDQLWAERVMRFWRNLVQSSKFGNQWQPHDQIWKFLKFKITDGRQNVGNAVTRLSIDQFERNVGYRMPSSLWHVSHDAVAMVTAVA